jgi:hypothetical protein
MYLLAKKSVVNLPGTFFVTWTGACVLASVGTRVEKHHRRREVDKVTKVGMKKEKMNARNCLHMNVC